MSRASYLPMSGFVLLDNACQLVANAFDGTVPYHVGSSTQRADWRDVDVRLILDDDEYAGRFSDPQYWSLFCLGVSEYLSRVSGLPVDFQVQRMTQANAEYGGEFRNPLGMPHHHRLYAGGPRPYTEPDAYTARIVDAEVREDL